MTELPEREFVVVGTILGPWGIRGKLKVRVLTDFPRRFAPGASVYIDRKPFAVEAAEWRRDIAVIKLQAIDSRQDVEALISKTVEIPYSQLEPLAEGQFYHFQIVGLQVWTTGGEPVGRITGILSSGSNDNYVVRGAGGEILIPAIADVVKSVDLERGRMVIEPMPGLLELNK